MSPIAAAINAFACDLYHTLIQENSGNFVFSPYSISLAFAMVQVGTRGETATELAKVFHYSPDMAKEFKSVAASASYDPAFFNSANGMFVGINANLLPDYVATLQHAFHATPYPTDFAGDLAAALHQINEWVYAQSRERIANILNKLDPNVCLVLVNAIAFKGTWEEPFKKSVTRDQPFTPLSGEESMVPMMAHRARYGYAKGEGWQAVILPYQEGRLAMMALLPDSGQFSMIEREFTAETVAVFNKGFSRRDIILEMPRWKSESSLDLRSILQRMGVMALFDDALADLSGMNGGRDLYVSDAQHQAMIEVNEEGTEATAATAVVVTSRSMMPEAEPPRVTFNRPFLYWIYDQSTGVVLFAGRYVE